MTDKYFALYWCFCVRNSFILLLIKWIEMVLNVKPQTLVQTFDQANYNSFPDRGEEGGGGNSIVFHLSFLTHSACQCDVT